MKSQAYRPSHDRIIIPNASSEHFKGHFIPVPTPHNTSQQSRWPDLNQVPLAGPWCPTPSDQQDICSANSIRFTLVSQKCMDLSLSDTTTHSFATAHEDATRWYWREQTAQREHAGCVHAQKHASSCHLVSLPWSFFLFFLFVCSNVAVEAEETDGIDRIDENIYEVAEMDTSCGTN